MPENVLKDRRFYELILVDSRSVMIQHHPKDSLKGPLVQGQNKTYSIFWIEKILSLKDWVKHFLKEKSFQYLGILQGILTRIILRPGSILFGFKIYL